MEYDDLHRIVSREVTGGGTAYWGYTANVSGATSYTNQIGKVTTYSYNAAGWKTQEVIVGMATNIFTYSAAGDLRTLSDGKSQVTKWGYDTDGRVSSKTNAADAVILAYLYDANSRMTNRWSLEKGNTAYSYDAVGSLTNINYPSSTDIRYEYDALNRMTKMVDAVGTTTWTFKTVGRYTVEDGPWSSDNVTNHWNTAGLRERLSILQPSSYFSTTYSYDAAKRLTNVTSGNKSAEVGLTDLLPVTALGVGK